MRQQTQGLGRGGRVDGGGGRERGQKFRASPSWSSWKNNLGTLPTPWCPGEARPCGSTVGRPVASLSPPGLPGRPPLHFTAPVPFHSMGSYTGTGVAHLLAGALQTHQMQGL